MNQEAPVPLVNTDWWKSHAIYSRARRQGIDIACVSFKHPDAKAVVLIVNGLTESFLKYAEIIQFFYEQGFSVVAYDHQSQGLSGRWLSESQSIWVHTFEDYVNDFVHIATNACREFTDLPMYVLAHSMGGFIAAQGMPWVPMIRRAVLCAPMLQMKCGMKCVDWRYPLPQPITYWMVSFLRKLGLGSWHALGFFKEKSTDPLPTKLTTHNMEQLKNWQELRIHYNQLVATCVTNDWVYHGLRASGKFSTKYNTVQTNTLILSAEHDYLVHNRAMAQFVKTAPSSRMLNVPGAYHEILCEVDDLREPSLQVILNYFNQRSDDVNQVEAIFPLEEYDPRTPIYSFPELVFRSIGVAVSAVGIVAGVLMFFSDRKR